MPWYCLHAGPVSGDCRSGAAVLGPLALVVVLLAVLAGWPATARIHRAAPVAAAALLAGIVLAKVVWPPAATSSFHASASDPLAQRIARSLAGALGLHYGRQWGLWFAVAGVAMTVAGTLLTLRRRACAGSMPPARDPDPFDAAGLDGR
jgi:hypothetical protein